MTEAQDPPPKDLDETIPTNLHKAKDTSDPDMTIPMGAPDLDKTVPTDFNTDNMDTIGMAATIPARNFNESDTNATITSPNESSGTYADNLTGQQWGDFELGRKIGQGGMGAVYIGKQVSLDRPVAIKVLPTHLSSDPSFRKRFELEAKAVALITSPYIIQVFGAGEHDGHSYFAMEFVEGKDLGERIKDGLRPTPEESAGFLLQAAKGLAAAGEHNLIHRDIKPGNMMVTDKGELKIMDFGLVKLKNEDGSSGGGLTMAGAVMGTVNYFSPEQGRGEECDQTTDIYALGVVFYQLLTGSLPFSGTDATAVIYQHIHAEPRALKEINPNIPDSYQAIITKCLQKDRRKRYQTAKELIKDLELIIEGAKPQHAPIEPNETTAAGSVADKKGSNAGLILVIILLLAGAGGYYWWDQQNKLQNQGNNQNNNQQNTTNNTNNNQTTVLVDPLVKAGQLLGTGKLDEADVLITQFLSKDPGNDEWLDLSKRLRILRAEEAIKNAKKAIQVEDYELAAAQLDKAQELGGPEDDIESLRAVIREHSGLATKLTVIRSHLSEGLPTKALGVLDEIGIGDAKGDAKVLKDLRAAADKMKGELDTAHKTLASGDIDTARGLFQASLESYPNAAARNGLKALGPAAMINRALDNNQVALAEEQLRELKVYIPESPAIQSMQGRIDIVALYVSAKQAAKRGQLEEAEKLLVRLRLLAPGSARVKDLGAYVKEKQVLFAFRQAVKDKDLQKAKEQMELLNKIAPESESVQIARREYADSKIEEDAAKKEQELFEQKIKQKVSEIEGMIANDSPDFNGIQSAMKKLVELGGSMRPEIPVLKVKIDDKKAALSIADSFAKIDKAILAANADVLPNYVADDNFIKLLGSFMNKADLTFSHKVKSVKRSGEQAQVRATLTNGYQSFPQNDLDIDYVFKRQENVWRIQSFKPVQ